MTVTMEHIATGKTIEEAIEAGCAALGLDRDSVSVEVLQTPSKGFLFGLGAQDAKVRLTYEVQQPDPKPQPAAPKPQTPKQQPQNPSRRVRLRPKARLPFPPRGSRMPPPPRKSGGSAPRVSPGRSSRPRSAKPSPAPPRRPPRSRHAPLSRCRTPVQRPFCRRFSPSWSCRSTCLPAATEPCCASRSRETTWAC